MFQRSTCQLFLAAALLGKVAAQETNALVAEASGQQAIAAGLEARLSEAEVKTARFHAQANNDLETAKNSAMMMDDAKAQIASAQVRAAVYEESARKAAAAAQSELKEIEALPAKVAKMAAEEAKKMVRAELDKAASEVGVMKTNSAQAGLPAPFAEAAAQAASPYYDAMQKSIAMGDLYQQSASTLSEQAQTLQEQSRSLASQSVAYQSAGNADMAAKLMTQARTLLSEAQAKDAQSKKDANVASNVLKDVPNYQANAALAAARATSLADPAAQPSPSKFLR